MAIHEGDTKLSYLEVFRKRGVEGAFKALFFVVCWFFFNTFLLHLPFAEGAVILYVIGFIFCACYFTWRSKLIGTMKEKNRDA